MSAVWSKKEMPVGEKTWVVTAEMNESEDCTGISRTQVPGCFTVISVQLDKDCGSTETSSLTKRDAAAATEQESGTGTRVRPEPAFIEQLQLKVEVKVLLPNHYFSHSQNNKTYSKLFWT